MKLTTEQVMTINAGAQDLNRGRDRIVQDSTGTKVVNEPYRLEGHIVVWLATVLNIVEPFIAGIQTTINQRILEITNRTGKFETPEQAQLWDIEHRKILDMVHKVRLPKNKLNITELKIGPSANQNQISAATVARLALLMVPNDVELEADDSDD